MGVPANIIVPFPGSVAQIPPGWIRCASLNARHTRGAAAGVDGGATGGGAVHVHTGASHSHSLAAHSHTLSGVSSSSTPTSGTVATDPRFSIAVESGIHTHPLSGTVNGGDTGLSADPSWQAVSLDPPYYTVVYLQSDGTPAGLPQGSMAWWNGSTAPSGWSHHTASAGRYLKGAVGGLGGAFTGGTSAHAHTGNSHTHSTSGHSHAGATAGVPSPPGNPNGVPVGGDPPATGSALAHTHPITMGSQSLSSTPTTPGATGTSAVEPPYTTLLPIVCTAPLAATVGAIALWLGTRAAVPNGWTLCDGGSGRPDCRGKFVKASASGADIGLTGGALSHTHSAPPNHAHDESAAHHHGISGLEADTGGVVTSSIGGASPNLPHTHPTVGAGPETGADTELAGMFTGAGTSVNALSDSRPAFQDVLYLALTTVLGVTITTPTANQAFLDDTPTIVWSIAAGTQADFRVVIFGQDSFGNYTILAYDSGHQTGTATSWAVPLGHLHNTKHYQVLVGATDTTGIFGVSAAVNFSIAMTPPTTLVITAVAQTAPLPGVLLSWIPPTLPGGDTFHHYTTQRRLAGDTLWTILATIATYGTTSYLDLTAGPGITYEYAVTYTDVRTGDQVASLEQSPPPSIAFDFIGIFIHVVQDPTIYLFYHASAEKVSLIQPQKDVPIWGREKPMTYVGEQRSHLIQFTGSAKEGLYPTTAIWENAVLKFFAAAATGEVLCLRMGNMHEVFFCILDPSNTTRNDELALFATDLGFKEITYDPAPLTL